VETIRVDLDWLRWYAALLDRHAAEASAVRTGLREGQLDDDVFGEIGRTLRTPQAYRQAAGSLLVQVDRAEEVLTAAASALRQAAEQYEGTDIDGARNLEHRGAPD